MRYVEAQGLRASVIGLGAWQFGSPEWGWGDGFGPAEAQAIVDRARQLGVTLIDTAETYGKGESERVLGHILASPEVRDSIVLASKVAPIWPTRDRVKVAAHASLERLGTDRLDLYQIHWPNPLVPQASTMAGIRALQAGGLVRYAGVSNYGLGRWRRAAPVLDALREVAAAHDATAAQVALAWVLHHPHVVAIPGAKSVAQVESNAAAAEMVLADDEFLQLNQAADRFHRDTLVSATAVVTRRARSLLRRG